LVDAGFVVEGGEDERAVDCFAAAGGVFEGHFGFVQIDDGFVELLAFDALEALAVEEF
jgi:hypothetical protein